MFSSKGERATMANGKVEVEETQAEHRKGKRWQNLFVGCSSWGLHQKGQKENGSKPSRYTDVGVTRDNYKSKYAKNIPHIYSKVSLLSCARVTLCFQNIAFSFSHRGRKTVVSLPIINCHRNITRNSVSAVMCPNLAQSLEHPLFDISHGITLYYKLYKKKTKLKNWSMKFLWAWSKGLRLCEQSVIVAFWSLIFISDWHKGLKQDKH